MHDRPDKAVLLDAITRFLLEDLRPGIADKALSFRLLIAAYLTRMVSAELRGEETQNQAELARLYGMLQNSEPAADHSRSAVEDATRRLNLELAAAVQSPDLSDAERQKITQHVRMTLAEKLRVVNPRFDLSNDFDPS